MILVDSSVWIDFVRGVATPQTDRLDALLGSEPLAVGDLILAEVLQGFRSERDFDPFVAHLGCARRWRKRELTALNRSRVHAG